VGDPTRVPKELRGGEGGHQPGRPQATAFSDAIGDQTQINKRTHDGVDLTRSRRPSLNGALIQRPGLGLGGR
jgi:hypothetical protein